MPNLPVPYDVITKGTFETIIGGQRFRIIVRREKHRALFSLFEWEARSIVFHRLEGAGQKYVDSVGRHGWSTVPPLRVHLDDAYDRAIEHFYR